MNFDYDNRCFKLVSNTQNGETNEETSFLYHQQGNIVWATYEGGDIVFGTLLAQMEKSGRLNMKYQHLNRNGEFRTGECYSIPEELSDGRYRIREFWKWTSGDNLDGESVLEEVVS